MKGRLKNQFISNYTISYLYGGLGNNLQQIALGIMYSNLKGCNFYVEENEFIKSISKVNNRFSSNLKRFKKQKKFQGNSASKNLSSRNDKNDFWF